MPRRPSTGRGKSGRHAGIVILAVSGIVCLLLGTFLPFVVSYTGLPSFIGIGWSYALIIGRQEGTVDDSLIMNAVTAVQPGATYTTRGQFVGGSGWIETDYSGGDGGNTYANAVWCNLATSGVTQVTYINREVAGGGGSYSVPKPSTCIAGPNQPPTAQSMTADKSSPQQTGTTITWTCTATDPENDVISYRFLTYWQEGGGFVGPNRDWSTANSWSIAWSNPGTYFVDCMVRDGKHATDPNQMDGFARSSTITLTLAPPPGATHNVIFVTTPVSGVTISISGVGTYQNGQAAVLTEGSSYTLTAAGPGGGAFKEWGIYPAGCGLLTPNNNNGAWSTTNPVTISQITCDITELAVRYTLPNLPPTISGLTPSMPSPMSRGNTNSWTCGASDPDGDPLNYRFSAKLGAGAYAVFQDWYPYGSASWTPSTAGTYTIKCEVQDGHHSAGADALKEVGGFVIQSIPFAFVLGNGGPIVGKPGDTLANTITVGMSGDVYRTVTLTCTGAPSGASCQLNPAAGSVPFSSTLTIQTNSGTVPGPYTITVTGSDGSTLHSTSFSVTINPPPTFDFQFSGMGGNQQVQQGQMMSTYLSVSQVPNGAQNAQVSLGCSGGLPDGTVCQFTSSPGTPPFTSTLTLQTYGTTTAGSYNIRVTGAGGSISHDVIFSLSVTPHVDSNFDFTISMQHDSLSVARGASATNDVNVGLVSGPATTVSLSASGLPDNAQYSLSTNSGTPPFTSTLTIVAAANTPPGGYSITVQGIGGSKTHPVTFTLSVSQSNTNATNTNTATVVCPSGSTWDPALHVCTGGSPVCPQGEEWNNVLGRCVSTNITTGVLGGWDMLRILLILAGIIQLGIAVILATAGSMSPGGYAYARRR